MPCTTCGYDGPDDHNDPIDCVDVLKERLKQNVLVFGHGEVGIGIGYRAGDSEKVRNVVVLYRTGNHNVGDEITADLGKSSDDLDTICQLVIEDPRSAVLLCHAICRASMEMFCARRALRPEEE